MSTSTPTTTDLEFIREVLANAISQKRDKLSTLIFDLYQQVMLDEKPELRDDEDDEDDNDEEEDTTE